MTQQRTFELTVPAIGSDCERILTEVETSELRSLILGETGTPESDDYLLAQFAGYVAMEILNADDELDSRQKFLQAPMLGADLALSMRRNGALSEWPENEVQPAFLYEYLEGWVQHEEISDSMTVAGKSLRELIFAGGLDG